MRLSLRHYGIKITHPLSVLQADGHSIHERSERHSNKEAFAPRTRADIQFLRSDYLVYYYHDYAPFAVFLQIIAHPHIYVNV